MSGAYRTYRGIVGETIRVPEATFAGDVDLHDEPHRYPFAELADRLGPQRNEFAALVSRLPIYREAAKTKPFRRWAERAR